MAKYTVAAVGATDYTGDEALRILAAHPDFDITCMAGHSSVGESMAKHMPHISQLANPVVEDTTPEVLNGHGVIIPALPHGASGKFASQFNPNAAVMDLDADHRLEEQATWDELYGGDFCEHWTYGIPEPITGKATDGSYTRQRAALPDIKRIAGPDCNVTATALTLQPDVAEGLVESQNIVTDLVVGYSGAGRDLKRTNLLATKALQSALPCSVGGRHYHIPGILQNFAHAAGRNTAEASELTLGFTPIFTPMSRSVLTIISARMTGKARTLSDEETRVVWSKAYENWDFIVLLPEGTLPATGNIVESDAAHLQIVTDRKTGRVYAFAAIDNLNRDTAGQTVQSLNIALDLPEDAGLIRIGVAS